MSTGKPFDVVCSFNNPLSTTMTNIEWIVEGAGLIKPDIVKIKGYVPKIQLSTFLVFIPGLWMQVKKLRRDLP